MKVNSNAEMLPLEHKTGAFCNTFDLHLAIIGTENQFLDFLRVTVLHRFYCSLQNVADINYVMEKVYAAHFCDMWGLLM